VIAGVRDGKLKYPPGSADSPPTDDGLILKRITQPLVRWVLFLKPDAAPNIF